MEEIKLLCEECINKELYQIVMSKPRKSGEYRKVKVRPVLLKGELMYQISETRGEQIFHINLAKEAAVQRVEKDMQEVFQQAEFTTQSLQATVLISKKGKITIKKKEQTKEMKPNLNHNKVKNYILPEGVVVPFLIDLGVQTREGKIVKSRYDKYRQINRYLEFVADILPILPVERKIQILDFGCGKSYLTFALYYYLCIICKRNVRIVGLDLKEKVIDECNHLARKYGYEDLTFLCGDVVGYEPDEPIDMVVTLHACDTATDYALEKAIKWDAKVIFSVPCCQHEVNTQIQQEILQPILKYGLLKERIAALITDGIRANLLEEEGYQVQVMEFIDMEHTPKNILIRAIRDKSRAGKKGDIRNTTKFLGVENTLQKLLEGR